MKTTKKVTCKAPKANTFCLVTAALFAAVILTGCPQPAGPGNGGGGGNGGGNTPAITWVLDPSTYVAPTWFADATGTEKEYIDGVATGNIRDIVPTAAQKAIGAPWAFDLNSGGTIGSEWTKESLLGENGIGFRDVGENGPYKYFYEGTLLPDTGTDPTTTTIQNDAFVSIYAGLNKRLTNANTSFGGNVKFIGITSWSGYNRIADTYSLKIDSVSADNGYYDVYYGNNGTSASYVLNFVAVFIKSGEPNKGYAIAIPTPLSVPACDSDVSKVANFNLGAFIKTLPSVNQTVMEDFLGKGYEIFLVVRTVNSGGNNLNELSQQCYKNVIKLPAWSSP